MCQYYMYIHLFAISGVLMNSITVSSHTVSRSWSWGGLYRCWWNIDLEYRTPWLLNSIVVVFSCWQTEHEQRTKVKLTRLRKESKSIIQLFQATVNHRTWYHWSCLMQSGLPLVPHVESSGVLYHVCAKLGTQDTLITHKLHYAHHHHQTCKIDCSQQPGKGSGSS